MRSASIAIRTTSGPSIKPQPPNATMPPSIASSTTNACMSSLPQRANNGCSTLSTLDTTNTPTTPRITAFVVSPESSSPTETGTQTRLVPMVGITDAKIVTAPSTSARGTPSEAYAIVAITPCARPVRPTPTARPRPVSANASASRF